jgi:glycosyltransferase involved in cell wall biosynthesis
MNIGISAIGFIPGKMGGTETYFRNLVHSLQRINQDNNYKIICDSSSNKGVFAFTNTSFETKVYRYAKPSSGWFIRGVLKNTLSIDIFKLALDGLKMDLIHYPFTVLSPMGLKTPTVLTFWDMQHEFYPEFFPGEELQRRRASYKPSAERATRIIVSADFTKRCLVEKYEIDAGKIDVVYTGYGQDYRVIDDMAALERIKSKHGLDRPFLYYPAATWPHKNHKTLLAALKILKDRNLFDGLLVLTGIAKQSQDETVNGIERHGLSEMVRLLGYLPYEELPYLYNLACALVFPSLFEGFGIPLVEAMACGCPVVSSNTTSLPEVLGDAGVMFDPHSAEDMAEKINSVWGDEARRREMRAKGLERVKLFNWDDTARRTLDVYAKTVNGQIAID